MGKILGRWENDPKIIQSSQWSNDQNGLFRASRPAAASPSPEMTRLRFFKACRLCLEQPVKSCYRFPKKECKKNVYVYIYYIILYIYIFNNLTAVVCLNRNFQHNKPVLRPYGNSELAQKTSSLFTCSESDTYLTNCRSSLCLSRLSSRLDRRGGERERPRPSEMEWSFVRRPVERCPSHFGHFSGARKLTCHAMQNCQIWQWFQLVSTFTSEPPAPRRGRESLLEIVSVHVHVSSHFIGDLGLGDPECFWKVNLRAASAHCYIMT
jgi:hypothetical protein